MRNEEARDLKMGLNQNIDNQNNPNLKRLRRNQLWIKRKFDENENEKRKQSLKKMDSLKKFVNDMQN